MLGKCNRCNRSINPYSGGRPRKYCSATCKNRASDERNKKLEKPISVKHKKLEENEVEVKIREEELRVWLRKRLKDRVYEEKDGVFRWREEVDHSQLPPPLTESQEEELKLILTVYYRNEEV